jgi:hypothetical protein
MCCRQQDLRTLKPCSLSTNWLSLLTRLFAYPGTAQQIVEMFRTLEPYHHYYRHVEADDLSLEDPPVHLASLSRYASRTDSGMPSIRCIYMRKGMTEEKYLCKIN